MPVGQCGGLEWVGRGLSLPVIENPIVQTLRTNKEILTIECSEPTTFRVLWDSVTRGQIKVRVDAELSAVIHREYTGSIKGLSWLCQPGEMIEVEARSPGIFQCQVTEVEDGQFIVKLQAPDDFLFLFEIESEVAA